MKEAPQQTGELRKQTNKLTKENDGQQLSVSVGDKISVTLPEHFTAGYRWSITQLDTNVIFKVEEKYIIPNSENFGAAGERKFVLQARNPATTDVALEEKRSWEDKEKPISTFKFTVLISS
jgi:predicted secreted protein